MLVDSVRVRLVIAPGQVSRLDLPARSRLRGLAGASWVTLDHDRRDIVLEPGQEFTLDAPGHAIVCALRADGVAELLVSEPVAAVAAGGDRALRQA